MMQIGSLHRALKEPMEPGNTSLYDAIYAALRLLNNAGRQALGGDFHRRSRQMRVG